MALQRVIDGVCRVAMGQANAYLIEGQDGLAMIDAGFPKKEAVLFAALRELGRTPDQLKHLILTHGHPDHIGSAAAVVRATGAKTYLHPADIPLAESGGPFRPMVPAPGVLRQVLCRVLYHPAERLDPVAIDQPLVDGETLAVAGGFDVIHAPGHCAGQVALFWRPGRMLFGGDAFMNMLGIGDPIGFEDQAQGRATQRRLAALDCDAVGLGHGPPLGRDGTARLRRWVARSA